jgi:hypothetical protein
MQQFDPSKCLQLLTQGGFIPACDPAGSMPNCQMFMNTPVYHASCGNQPPYTPVINVCCQNENTREIKCFANNSITQCMALHQQDPAWDLIQCYCCCDGPGFSQSVAVRSGIVPLASLRKGDAVLAGSVRGSAGRRRLAWSSAAAGFSAGLASNISPCVLIGTGGKAARELSCAPDQPVLLADGTVTTADRLRLDDILLDLDGNPAPIRALGFGPSPLPLHNLATSVPFNGSLDGRLLCINGLVVGDYDLQLRLAELAPAALAADHAARARRNASTPPAADGTSRTRTVGFRATDPGVTSPIKLSISEPVDASAVPNDARTFFTPDQMADVAANGTLVPASDPQPQQNVDDASKLLGAVFHGITISYDPGNLDPTVYAYRHLIGGNLVQINGGLARQSGLKLEGITMAIAWGIACLVAGAPKNKNGYSAVGLGDLFSFETIGRRIWTGTSYLSNALAAFSQWQALFALVSPAHASGDPQDPIDDPSLACRVEAVQSAIGGGALPPCAGGGTATPLELNSAMTLSLSFLQLGFNEPVWADNVPDVTNYTLDPAAAIIAAVLDPSNTKSVLVVSQFQQGQQYEITVRNLKSGDGAALDPEHASLDFTAVK